MTTSTFDRLSPRTQQTIRGLRAEAADFRVRLRKAQSEIADVRKEAATYRVRLRAAEARIAELEAARDAQ
ncbi:hypothetical protein [Rhodococcus triatomae]|nr:hypothetical protein G419_16223 [Rhodococcus triatomae BKS 15-14]